MIQSPVQSFRTAGRWVLALALGVAAATAHAQPAPTPSAGNSVKVGKFTKIASGTVTEINPGDAACYVTLKDERGQAFNESAEFSFCEKPKAYIGKRVTLGYKLGQVMADECGGNVNCKKTVQVALIDKMTVGGSAMVAAAAPAAPEAKGQASFCTPMETVVFACRTGAKMVSVCAANGSTASRGYLQYRFGKPDSRDPLEIMLPESELVASKVATGENTPFAGGGGSWLRFRKGAFSYVVYTGIGRWGPNGEPREKAGLAVERDGKLIANLKCAGAPVTQLGPQWFQDMGVKPKRDEDFLFPD